MRSRRRGITAIEVLVSTLLASLLMVAMLGVLRGLKAQAAALDTRLSVPNWQRTLSRALQTDLANSQRYQLTGQAMLLQGFAGRDPNSGLPNWKPTTIVYEIANDGERSWLIRRDPTSGRREFVLAEVSSIKIGVSADSRPTPTPLPIVDGLIVELWGEQRGEPLYGYRFRKP